MKIRIRSALAGILALSGLSCTTLPSPSPPTQFPTPTPTLPACTDAHETVPFPTLTPAPVEDLQNIARAIDDCWVETGTAINYPCTRRESIEESYLSQTPTALLILRHERQSAGCWTAVTSEQTMLRHVNRQTASTTIVANRIRSDVIPSPDGMAFAFGASETSESFELQVYRVRVADGQVMALTPRALPQPQVVGVRFLGWSDEGAWLHVSLWDGSQLQGGWHDYRLPTDGSGAFERP